MAAINNQGVPSPAPSKQLQSNNQPHHQRTKSSVLRTFIKGRRNDATGDVSAAQASGPLEEMSLNRQQQPPMDVAMHTEKHYMAPQLPLHGVAAASSPTKRKKLTRDAPPPLTLGPSSSTENEDNNTSLGPPPSPNKKSRTRTTTNLVGLLSRPKSFKSLRKKADDDAEGDRDGRDDAEPSRGRERSRNRIQGNEKKREKPQRNAKEHRDKENRGLADATAAHAPTVLPPIYAQFCSTGSTGSTTGSASPTSSASSGHISARPSTDNLSQTRQQWSSIKPRPKSFHPGSTGMGNSSTLNTPMLQSPFKVKTLEVSPSRPALDPKDIDVHLDALLDRRNIPEHQRYKMRNLADAIKLELIRQDWAEERSKRQQQQQEIDTPYSSGSIEAALTHGSMGPGSSASNVVTPTAQTPSDEVDPGSKASKSKHSRVKSLTLSKVTRGRSRDRGDSANGGNSKRHKSPGSPLKKRAEGTLARHLRSKSTESFKSNSVGYGGDANNSDAALSAGGKGSASSAVAGLFSMAKGPQQNSPGDFMAYLRTVQAPEKVEVGKLHKLRLLLRNETVAWIEDFIGQGGMEEVVGLLHRIMAVEWREEHEDALLHENLLCLKALCTTALGLEYLHAIHANLLPALIHMIFDPEKKGPSEFTTRNIVTWVLFTYIQSALLEERPARAQTVLGYLRDPEGEEDERPVSFVLEMRKDRPYRVWCKEVVNVTKEVFWIFLHHLNVVSLPSKEAQEAVALLPPSPSPTSPSSYMARHFPKERPPVPAAPYVGGVEWEATNYLASHLDLTNAILACTPTAAERNHLRGLMQMSGWERCLGCSLRLCKEKFYGAVHDGLRVWVAAAHEDGWDVRDVRFGPPSSEDKKRAQPVVGGPKAAEPAPKLDFPKLDFILDD